MKKLFYKTQAKLQATCVSFITTIRHTITQPPKNAFSYKQNTKYTTPKNIKIGDLPKALDVYHSWALTMTTSGD